MGSTSVDLQFDTIKDFLVLHYRQSQGRTEPLWRYFHELPLPDRLVTMMENFRRTARIEPSQWDQFKAASWFSVLLGQGAMPEDYDPLADNIGDDALINHLAQVRGAIARAAHAMPTHEAYIRANCAASLPS
ncbi:tryptophan 7-halogenase [Sphingomonas sp. 1P08PE]|uniref:tryptophan 7-halogenase n=1 Tax=Sphingomonas sp. 1P08PE TaxID=554122 RepID=UPI0039A23B46